MHGERGKIAGRRTVIDALRAGAAVKVGGVLGGGGGVEVVEGQRGVVGRGGALELAQTALEQRDLFLQQLGAALRLAVVVVAVVRAVRLETLAAHGLLGVAFLGTAHGEQRTRGDGESAYHLAFPARRTGK